MRNLPYPVHLTGNRFVFLPEFVQKDLNKVFKLKSCIAFAVKLDVIEKWPKDLKSALEDPEVGVNETTCPFLKETQLIDARVEVV